MRAEAAPDSHWVALLAGSSAARAGAVLEEARGDRALYRHLARKHREAGRPSYGEIDAPLELYAIARMVRPRQVVEVGVSSGVSSAYLLAALDRNRRGVLHSVDRPSRPPPKRPQGRPLGPSWAIPEGEGSGWAVPARLRRRWDLRIGDKRDLLPRLAEELDRVDLFVYDVPHDDRDAAREFRAIDRRFGIGSVAIADHGPGGGLCPSLRGWAHRRGATPHQCQDLGLYGFRSLQDGPA